LIATKNKKKTTTTTPLKPSLLFIIVLQSRIKKAKPTIPPAAAEDLPTVLKKRLFFLWSVLLADDKSEAHRSLLFDQPDDLTTPLLVRRVKNTSNKIELSFFQQRTVFYSTDVILIFCCLLL
jgi:hypothetical protein